MIFHYGIDFRNVQKGITEDAGHVLIHFHDKRFALPISCGSEVVGSAKAKETLFIYRGNSGDNNIYIHEVPTQSRYLMEVIRHEIAKSDLNQSPIRPTHELRIGLNTVRKVWRKYRSGSVLPGKKLEDFDVF